MKWLLLTVCLLWNLIFGELKGQDPVFSLPFEQKLFSNPAFSGLGVGEINLGFRDQMPGSPARYITSITGWNQPFDLLHGGVGVLLTHDMAGEGTFSTTSISVLYAYHLRISRNLFLNAGFQASVFQNYLNTNDLVLPDMISPSQGIIGESKEVIPSERKIFPDFSVGFLLYSDNWFTTISAHHLMEPYQSEVKTDETVLSRKYSVLLGYVLKKNHGDMTFYPWVELVQQGISHQTLLGFQMKYLMTSGGVAWRKNFGNSADILIFSLGIVTKQIRITYSYDAYLGKIAISSSGGAHEIGMIISFGNKKSSYRGTINWLLM